MCQKKQGRRSKRVLQPLSADRGVTKHKKNYNAEGHTRQTEGRRTHAPPRKRKRSKNTRGLNSLKKNMRTRFPFSTTARQPPPPPPRPPRPPPLVRSEACMAAEQKSHIYRLSHLKALRCEEQKNSALIAASPLHIELSKTYTHRQKPHVVAASPAAVV